MKNTLKVLSLIAVSALIVPQIANAAEVSTNGSSPETTSQATQTSWITTKVKSVLLKSNGAGSASISVDSTTSANDKDAIVTLSGTQKSQALIDKAVAAAKGVKGVKQVVNTMTVEK